MRRAPAALPLVAALLAGVWTAVPAQETAERELRWRVAGAADALEETTRVRIVVAAELRADQANENLGIVQTAAYLFSSGADGPAHPLDNMDADDDLTVASIDPDLLPAEAPPPPLTVTVEPPGTDPDSVAIGLVVGRPLRLVAVAEATRRALEAGGRLAAADARVDPAELRERRRWAADALILPGRSRIIWEGAVPLTTNRVYADYLVVRPARVDLPDGAAGERLVRDPMRTPEGGILDMPARATAVGAPAAVSVGPALARPQGPRVFPLVLERGVLNEVRLRAYVDPTGAYRVDLEVRREPE